MFVAVVVLAALFLAVVVRAVVAWSCCLDLRKPVGAAVCTPSVANPAAPSTQVERYSADLNCIKLR